MSETTQAMLPEDAQDRLQFTERRTMDNDVRDRLARAEQDIKNQKENFQSFKSDDFGSLKREVHSMRNELNIKIDELHTLMSVIRDSVQERTNAINLTIAKWTGALGVIALIFNFAAKRFF